MAGQLTLLVWVFQTVFREACGDRMIGVRKYHPTYFLWDFSSDAEVKGYTWPETVLRKYDGLDKSPALSSSSPIIKNSSALFGNSLTICCETVPCTKVMAPRFWYTVRMTDYAQLLSSPGVLHNTAQGKNQNHQECVYIFQCSEGKALILL